MKNLGKATVMAAVVVGGSLLLMNRSQAQDVDALAYACDNGDVMACNQLMRVARSACLNGNSVGCNLAAQLAQMGISGTSDQGYPSYQNPLAPYSDTIRDTNDYINSYCSDPKIASQLRAFNYCR